MLPAVSDKALSITFNRELPKYFHKHEIDEILASVQARPKVYLLISMLWQTGARVTEILQVRVQDIDFYGKCINITTLKRKSRPKRIIPIKDNLIGHLGVYIAENGIKREDLVFNITRQRAHQLISDAVKKAGFDKERAHPHTFRHSFAVFAVLNKVPLLVIKNWLGHSNINSTMIYLQVLGSDTREFYDALNF